MLEESGTSKPKIGLNQYGIIPMKPYCNPHMITEESRLATYKNWQLANPTPEQLSKAGMYYTGVSDIVKCFHCDISLGQWTLLDDAWTEHALYSPRCSFVRLIKGDTFAMHPTSTSQPRETPTPSEKPNPTAKIIHQCLMCSHAHLLFPKVNDEIERNCIVRVETRTKTELFICKICTENKIETVLLPCGHALSCTECTSKLWKCPMCRAQLTAISRIYIQ